MNGLHDNPHKRTSITELLNPVASSVPPAAALNAPPYASSPLSTLSSPTYGASPHQQHVSPPASHYSVNGAGNSFSLRAASWDHPPSENGLGTQRRQDANASSSSCRYDSSASHSHQTNSHSVYSEQYQRPRDQASNCRLEPPWPPNSHEPSPPAQYHHSRQVSTPVYPDERTALNNGDPAQKTPTNYAPPPPPPQQVQPVQYEQQEMHPAAAYIPNAYQSTERVSVRLAARAMHPQAMLQQRVPSGMSPGVQAVPQVYLTTHPGMFAIPVVMQPPPPPPPPKRQLDSGDDEPAPKKKARGGKAIKADGGPKRNYNSKKRNDTPQNGHASQSNGKGKERESSKDIELPPTPVASSGSALHPELQFARCMSNRYRSEEFPRCVSCTRRWAGDTCRFQGIRFFLKDENRNIIGISFVENHKADGPSMSFPPKWNIPLQLSHIERTKRTVARALMPVLKKEQEHIKHPEVIRRTRESEVRATCDTCMTSIFSSSWMCRLCGREACEECFSQVRELTTDRQGATEAEIAALQARREKHAHINPFFLSCTRRNEHRATDFSPMSRFSKDELDQAIIDMEALLAENPMGEGSTGSKALEYGADQSSGGVPNSGASEGASAGPSDSTISTGSAFNRTAKDISNGEKRSDGPVGAADNTFGGPSSGEQVNGGGPVKTPDTEMSLKLTKTSLDSPVSPEPSTFAGASGSSTQVLTGITTIPVHQVRRFTDAELTDDVFCQVWALGQPIVVTDLGSKFRVDWSPEYFKHKYGSQSCLILECQTDQNKRVTVGEFFSWFGKYEGRRDCWKLKDWPPSTDFKTAFPELYDDFSQATPVPNYVRRDGVYNVASHFPSNTVAPDLGPKMYNAMASYEAENSKGSTRLHMDMADAVNIMLYAASTPDGRPGYAVWDLFRSDDSPKLRKFLRRKFKGQYTNDPIHSQQFYLDSKLRQELYDEFGVKSYRIYQKPGEAVFIPAGCAHQVCNLADCIKVASDFVSPENIDRCEMLTREFREQNQSMAWKEDVLQLRTMMWFAWLSCTRQEKDMMS